MAYALRHGLTWCVIQDQPVFLDLSADRYFALDGSSAGRLLRLAQCPSASGQCVKDADPLIAAGILCGCEAQADIGPCRHPVPRASLTDEDPPGRQPGGLPRTLFQLGMTALRARRRSLGDMLGDFQIRKGMLGPVVGSTDSLRLIAWRYHYSRRILMPLDRCLVRAISLADDACRAGWPVSLVFGVQLRPFGAHCWVEYEGLVLDDSLDHVRRFTPILAL